MKECCVEWFGLEASIQEYLGGIQLAETFFAWHDEKVIGFIALKTHFGTTAELYVLGVLPDYHHQGLGSLLMQSVENYLKSESISMMTVKTLGPSINDLGYHNTRKFYLALGFIPLEEFKEIWDENNPCLFMAKAL